VNEDWFGDFEDDIGGGDSPGLGDDFFARAMLCE
jgi:hypothetical protein